MPSPHPAVPSLGGCFGLLLMAAAACGEGPQFAAAELDFFEKHVRPVLVANCVSCHGPKKQESGLRLDSRAAILAGGELGKAVTLDKPEASPLLAAIRQTGDVSMPPEGKLKEQEIAAISAWIAAGLPWPAEETAVAPETMTERLARHRAEHWAYQPIRDPKPPEVRNDAWTRTPIDRFVLARLEAAGLEPSPDADRRTLIRRLSLDLVGLPPTPAEVAAFVDDPAPDAYERLVDRLLTRPGFGERWGRHWLDVARYADTKGYAFQRERRYPFAYTYRDYVIHSLNADKPYDRFVQEQLAADLLPDADSRALAGLGFLTVGRRYNRGHLDIDDRIDVISQGLLGLTVSCARCHNHKYDAIPTADYYSLYGVLDSAYEPDELPVIGAPGDQPGYAAFKRELDQRQAAVERYKQERHAAEVAAARAHIRDYLVRIMLSETPERELEALKEVRLKGEAFKRVLFTRWRDYLSRHRNAFWHAWHSLADVPAQKWPEQGPDVAERLNQEVSTGLEPHQINPLVRAAILEDLPESKVEVAVAFAKLLDQVARRWEEREKKPLSDAEQQVADVLFADDSPLNIRMDEISRYLTRAERTKLRNLEKRIDELKVTHPGSPPRAMVLRDKDRPVEPVIFERGNPGRRGDRVPRQFLELLDGESRAAFTKGSGRREVAERIVAADNPLASRVIVNRVWMHLFREPLVATPSDFGVRSDPPTHPELLDHLAAGLQERDWSLKRLIRGLVLSSAYRQQSLDRPAARDIDSANRLLWRQRRKRLEFEVLRDSLLAASGQLDRRMGGRPDDHYRNLALHRRSVYGYIDRQDLPGLLRVFDFASPDQTIAMRPRTTVPQQALFLLNGPLVMAQGKALLNRPEIEAASPPRARIAALYARLFGRAPTDDELSLGEAFIRDASAGRTSPWARYVQLLLMTNEFAFVD